MHSLSSGTQSPFISRSPNPFRKYELSPMFTLNYTPKIIRS
jgi:hypothetical protein